MSVLDETKAYVESLGELTPYGSVLAALSLELAESVDFPPDGAGGGKLSIGPFANSLRAALAELAEKGQASADDDDDWAGIAADAGATPIRDSA